MNSNPGQDFKDIRSLTIKLQRISRDEDTVVNQILRRIDALDQLYVENGARDLIEIKEKLKGYQGSQQRISYNHTIKHLRETLENYLSNLSKDDLGIYLESSSKTPPPSFGTKRRKKSQDLFLDKSGGRNNPNLSNDQDNENLMKAENSLEESEKRAIQCELNQKSWTERSHYNIANEKDKAYAIKLAEEKGPRAASKETGFPLKNIKRWMITGPSRKKGGGRKTLDPVMEEKLYQWIVGQQKTSGELLTRFEIKKKAKEMSSVDTFKASKGWLDKFKKRFGIIVRPSALESEGIESTGLAHTSSNLNDRKLSNVRGDAALEHNIENSIQFEKEIPSKLDSEENFTFPKTSFLRAGLLFQ